MIMSNLKHIAGELIVAGLMLGGVSVLFALAYNLAFGGCAV